MSAPTSDLQRLEVSNLVTMFVLDPTALGGSIQRFHNDSNFSGGNIVWQGNTYTRFPVEAKGFEFSARGKMPRPTVTVANVLGTAGALLRQYNDLIGATLTRKRTLARYLDAVNFPAGYLSLPGGGGGANQASTPHLAAHDFGSGSFSVEAIFKPTAVGAYQVVCGFPGASGNFRAFITSANALCLFWGSDAQKYTASAATVASGTEYYAVWGFNAATGKVFYSLNGSYQEIAETNHPVSGGSSFYVGNDGAGYPFTGQVKVARLFGRAFSAAECASRYAGVLEWDALVSNFAAARANHGATTLVAERSGETYTVNGAATLAGGNPSADPSVYLPDDVYVVDRKAVENKTLVTWEIASALDVQGVQLPRRQVIQNTCAWVYKSAECGYVPGTIWKIDDTPAPIPEQDVCGHRLSSCKVRFGASAELPYGGFPGAGLT